MRMSHGVSKAPVAARASLKGTLAIALTSSASSNKGAEGERCSVRPREVRGEDRCAQGVREKHRVHDDDASVMTRTNTSSGWSWSAGMTATAKARYVHGTAY